MRLIIGSFILGYILSLFLPAAKIIHTSLYQQLIYTILAIGLYGSVHGIDLDELKIHKNIILTAISFGVVFKSLLVGAILFLLLKNPYSFVLGMIVAQIDPLSVAHLLEGKSKQFSSGARTILRAWSSFDDPMTVLFSLYLYLPLALATTNGNQTEFSFSTYFVQLILNLGFSLILYLVYKFVQKDKKLISSLLIVAFLIAVPLKLMLSLAIIGLFIRPQIPALPKIVHGAFLLALMILGFLFVPQMSHINIGILLGVLAYTAQIAAAFIVARKLTFVDKMFLALAQYNGITSIILALIISTTFPQTTTTVASAVITINVLYFIVNNLWEKHIR